MSHTMAKPRQVDTSIDSQTMIGRHFESDPAGASRRYENLATPTDDSSRHLGGRARSALILMEWALSRM
jgi:hypothetical protein